jgi:hypothetical protein
MTALPNRRVYRDGTDLERDCEALMRFKLTYAGSLLSHKPLDQYSKDVRAWHKHEIRRRFHPQLEQFWCENHFLNTMKTNPDAGHNHGKTMDEEAWKVSSYSTPMREALKSRYQDNYHPGFEYGWVPLAREEYALAVSLRILCLRRDGPGAVGAGRDIDNRIKTLIDALTLPTKGQGCPRTRDGQDLPPGDNEKPYFYVLLANDKLVDHLEVETDTALELNPDNPADEDFVRLVISVEIRPTMVNAFNLNFA